MCNFLTQYEAVLNSAVESANTYLDMEGGAFILALTSELVQSLTDAGNHEGAILVIQRVCETIDVDCRWTKQKKQRDETAEVWSALFAETLAEHLEAASE